MAQVGAPPLKVIKPHFASTRLAFAEAACLSIHSSLGATRNQHTFTAQVHSSHSCAQVIFARVGSLRRAGWVDPHHAGWR